MKRIMLILFCVAAVDLQAQEYELGVKGGVNYAQSVILNVVSLDGVDVADVESQKGSALVFGGFARATFGRWIVQPEILFSENQSLVTLADANVNEMDLSDLFSMSVDKCDVPILLGYQAFGSVKLMAGPVFTTVRSTMSDPLFSLKDMTVGYQTGINFDINKLTFDARYEGNLSKFKEYVETEKGMLEVDTRKSLFQFTVGYTLFD
ncbi:MAG TPA: outer membrane beta-barrel protein [Chitinophagales bacterium]|nr:PorT family protein [Chitinophagales bacterium]HMU69245.1 outer membrane beta-barrel protein [Chitinophagales bacterium]HMX04252.1 outer membrane beta-barrel protein [Chitinophagales bacterium]HMZ88684.1 outer membrane beta-barrel protein [Chitinophagales bacterium]HNA58867.1 outer membrane beta-barrel protein [Chitinophagales bacterium]